MKRFIIYLTENNVNNKKYVWLHVTDNIDDNYLGSGVIIKKAIRKYGKKAFIKSVIDILYFIYSNLLMSKMDIEIFNKTLT